MKRYVIIGNGIAGISAAETIRSLDRSGKITVIAAEPYHLYSRPGIAYHLLGQVSEERLFCRPVDYYEQKRINHKFTPARQIDWTQKQVILDNGLSIPYDKLLIATGASANRPKFKGVDLQGVVTLSNMDDVHSIKRLLPQAKSGVVVGGGITAIELVEIFHHHGLETHYLQRGSRFWHRLLTEYESMLVENRLKQKDVFLHHKTEITEIIGEQGRVVGVKTTKDEFIPCQLVGAAVGITPNTKLVDDTIIACDRGILVNERLETTLPDIYAAGDVAQLFDPLTGKATLDLLWHSALKEGRSAGINMTGRVAAYRKDFSFNSALLFDIPFTSIGDISLPGGDNKSEHVSLMRGFSESWLSSRTVQADDRELKQEQAGGNESLRLVMRDNRLVGGVLLGNQTTADAARDLIVQQVDISPIKRRLFDNKPHSSTDILVNYWRRLNGEPYNEQINKNGNYRNGKQEMGDNMKYM